MTDTALQQVDAFITPGALLRTARQARGMSEDDVEDRLHWMPGYVAKIEADDFESLHRPAFARGYVRAYGKLMGVDEAQLLAALDQLDTCRKPGKKRVITPSLQLQRTGIGVVFGLVFLFLLVVALWLWRGGSDTVAVSGDTGVTQAEPAASGGEGER